MNKRSKRKHLSKDIKTKGYLFVLKNYKKLPQSFYTAHVQKIVNNQKYNHGKIEILNALLNNECHTEKTLNKIIEVYLDPKNKISSYTYDQDGNSYITSFWSKLLETQKLNELFFIENILIFEKLNTTGYWKTSILDYINTELNPWALPENQSDELKLLLRLRK